MVFVLIYETLKLFKFMLKFSEVAENLLPLKCIVLLAAAPKEFYHVLDVLKLMSITSRSMAVMTHDHGASSSSSSSFMQTILIRQ